MPNPPVGAVDITDLFLPGRNTLTIRLYDQCDHLEGTFAPIMLSVH